LEQREKYKNENKKYFFIINLSSFRYFEKFPEINEKLSLEELGCINLYNIIE